jgi:hypothetical protein
LAFGSNLGKSLPFRTLTVRIRCFLRLEANFRKR